MMYASLLWLSGCVINGDKYPRPRDLPPNWLVERTRILGIQAEPPEAVPGQSVTFRSLIAHPPGEVPELGVLWLACPVDDEGNGFGCATSFDSIDVENLDPSSIAELGIIGFEPGWLPSYDVPLDLLDGLDERQRLEGRYVVVQVTALPLETLQEPIDEVDFSEIQSAYKRLIVSAAETPNHNPLIGALTIDGHIVPDEAEVVHVDPGQAYELGVLLHEDAIETYSYVPRSGPAEERVEEPYISWYATGGELLAQVSLWPHLNVLWVAPEEPGTTGTWYMVLRDRRGGMSWLTQDFVVGKP